MDATLTQQELAEIKKSIRRQIEELVKQTASLKLLANPQGQERTGDEGDLASRNADEAVTAKLLSRNTKQVKALNVAMQRLHLEDFGVCEGCGDDIGLKRLILKPTTELCLPCATAAEKDKKRHEKAMARKTGFSDFEVTEEGADVPSAKVKD